MAISTVRSSSQPFWASMASWSRACSARTFSISASDRGSEKRAVTASKSWRSWRVEATPSSMFWSTVLSGFSRGSWGRWPIRIPSWGRASPRKSSSTPAMIRSRLDFPDPLAPRTPILAPKKKDREIPRRISRLGGTTLRRSRIWKM